MQPDAPALLWQAYRAARGTLDFVSGRTFEDYEHDFMLKSAVERQFQIIVKLSTGSAGSIRDR